MKEALIGIFTLISTLLTLYREHMLRVRAQREVVLEIRSQSARQKDQASALRALPVPSRARLIERLRNPSA